MIGNLDEFIRPLVLILPKMNGYVKIFEDKGGDKNKNNKLKYLRIDKDKLFEEIKTFWTKVKDFKNNELNTAPVFVVMYIKTKIKTYGNNVYTNFCGLSVPEDGVECKSLTVISSDSLLVYDSKCYLQVYIDNCPYRIVYDQMIDYFDDNLFETDED